MVNLSKSPDIHVKKIQVFTLEQGSDTLSLQDLLSTLRDHLAVCSIDERECIESVIKDLQKSQCMTYASVPSE